MLYKKKYVKAQEVRNDFRNWENASERFSRELLHTYFGHRQDNKYLGGSFLKREFHEAIRKDP